MAVNSDKTIFTMDDDNKVYFNTLKKQIQSVLGSSSWDLEDMCASSLIKIGAKYKPVRSSTPSDITEAERREVNWGLLAKDNASIKTNFIHTDSEAGNPFTSYDIEAWEYLRPRGNAVTPTEYNRIRDFDGYNHRAVAPLAISSSAVEVNMNNGRLENINANVNGQSILQYGSIANIELLLQDLNFRAIWSTISNNLLDGNWRLAVAIKMKRGSGYKWLIASTVKPLEIYSNTTDAEYNAHRIMLNVGNFAARIKNLARYSKASTFECVPFLAYGLLYTEAKGWYWSGDANNRAITFPNADKFNLTLTGFATTINVVPTSTIVKINGTQATAIVGSTGVGLRIARSIAAAATTAEVTFKFNVSSCFGVNTQLKGVSNIGGYTPSSLSGKGASGTSTFNSEGLEWDSVNEEYTMTYNDAGLVSVLKATASQSSVGNIGSTYDVGIQFYNSVLDEQLNFHSLVSFITIAFS